MGDGASRTAVRPNGAQPWHPLSLVTATRLTTSANLGASSLLHSRTSSSVCLLLSFSAHCVDFSSSLCEMSGALSSSPPGTVAAGPQVASACTEFHPGWTPHVRSTSLYTTLRTLVELAAESAYMDEEMRFSIPFGD